MTNLKALIEQDGLATVLLDLEEYCREGHGPECNEHRRWWDMANDFRRLSGAAFTLEAGLKFSEKEPITTVGRGADK